MILKREGCENMENKRSGFFRQAKYYLIFPTGFLITMLITAFHFAPQAERIYLNDLQLPRAALPAYTRTILAIMDFWRSIPGLLILLLLFCGIFFFLRSSTALRLLKRSGRLYELLLHSVSAVFYELPIIGLYIPLFARSSLGIAGALTIIAVAVILFINFILPRLTPTQNVVAK